MVCCWSGVEDEVIGDHVVRNEGEDSPRGW